MRKLRQHSYFSITRKVSIYLGFVVAALVLPVSPVMATLHEDIKPQSDTIVYDFLYIGTKYQNQFAFLGRNFGQPIPFVTGDLTYNLNSNLWISGSAYQFIDNAIAFQTSLSAGYRGDISSRVDFNISAGQFFMQSGEGSANIDLIGFYQGGVGLDWTILYSTLQMQVMTYSTQDYFLISQHSRYFLFNNKLFNKIEVAFQPMFTVTVGSSRFYYVDDPILQNRGIVNPKALARKAMNPSAGNNAAGVPGTTNPGQGQGKGQGQGNSNGNSAGGNSSSGGNSGAGTTTPVPVPSTSSANGSTPGFLSWEVALPISFQWGNFTFECTSRYASPMNVIEGDPSRPVFIQSFDLYYSIPIKRKKKIRI
jgi:uncharacterized membrane protein YgcG